jgi:hypothetical protein
MSRYSFREETLVKTAFLLFLSVCFSLKSRRRDYVDNTLRRSITTATPTLILQLLCNLVTHGKTGKTTWQ